MRKLVRACAPWLTWRIALVAAVAMLGVGIAVGAKAGLLAFLGATPILAIAACMLPCLIPLALSRRNKEEKR